MIDEPWIRDRSGADALEEGYFLLKKRRAGRIDVPVRVFFGPPLDPDTGEEMDRAPLWQLEINGVNAGYPERPACISGRPVDSLEGIWPECKSEPIDKAEYDYRVARADWAEQHDENDPFGGTGAKVDPMTATLPFL
jgi:hypothetical protein